jgi:hypothetical protein
MMDQHKSRRISSFGQGKALLVAWLTQDLFGKARRSGKNATSSLTPTLFSQGFLTFAFAALTYQEVGTTAFVAGNLAFAMVLTLTAMLGEVLGDDQRKADEDFVLTSPISPFVLHAAKAVHSLLVLLLFHFGLVLAPAILGMWNGGIAYVWAIPLASILLVGAVAGVLASMMELLQKWRGPSVVASFSSLVQTFLISSLFLGSLLGLRAMFQGPSAFPGGISFLQILPPYWAARVTEWMADGRDPGVFGWWFLCLILLPFGIQALSSLIPLRPRGSKPRRERIPFVASFFGTSRADQGMLRFTLTLLARDPAFRLRAVPLLGLPVAVVLLALHSGVSEKEVPFFFALVHNLPLAWLPFLLHFVPYAMDYEASWLTRLGPEEPLRAGRRGVLLSFAILMLRLQVLLFLLDFGFRGFGPALLSSLQGFGLALVLLPFLMASLEEVPFSQDPADLKPPEMGGGPMLLAILVPVLALGFEALPMLWGVFLCILLIGVGRKLVASSFRLDGKGG